MRSVWDVDHGVAKSLRVFPRYPSGRSMSPGVTRKFVKPSEIVDHKRELTARGFRADNDTGFSPFNNKRAAYGAKVDYNSRMATKVRNKKARENNGLKTSPIKADTSARWAFKRGNATLVRRTTTGVNHG